MKTLQSEALSIDFLKKYYIIIGNNGNHSGYNRTWETCSEGYNLKSEANKVAKEIMKEADILTPVRIVNAEEMIELIDSIERVSYRNCFDLSATEIEQD